ncbi:MAG: hypothetical protein EOO27_02890 [Comamonadaceae bacterium]|nr:MAG: hypothetical protein EOO27_02890 [Comamonadaceae bacterium]
MVSEVLGTERSHLKPVREALRADEGALHHRLLSIREEASLPEEISALRVFDVIAWMDGKNRCLGDWVNPLTGEDDTSRGNRGRLPDTMRRMGIRAAAALQAHVGLGNGNG